MSSQKRKASVKEAAPPGKRARRSTGEVEAIATTRPRREVAGTPKYNFTRTRKRTDRVAVAQDAAGPEQTSVPPKRRGRPPKQSAVGATSSTTTTTIPARPRGRPKSSTSKDKSATEGPVRGATNGETVKKPRGRPPKANGSNTTAQSGKGAVKTATKKVSSSSTALVKGTKLPARRGRPPKEKAKPAADSTPTVASEEASATDGSDVETTEEEQTDRQYWLMKAEPNDRFENGVNVKFSIDDLAAAEAPEPWDGVRNYGARNNMRAMRRGDLAFFYHSNCQVPGIVGVMRVVQEHTPDQSAFDPKHPYYDPKSVPSNPKWDCVHVEFVKKFDTQITLKMLQEERKTSGKLASMQLLKMGRLSVSAVSPKEWMYILDIVKEDVHLGEDNGAVQGADGYESDTDGETLANANETVSGTKDETATGEVQPPRPETHHARDDLIDETEN